MSTYKIIFITTFVLTALLRLDVCWSGSDMPGSKDHPKIPRVAGTTIVGFAENSYDEGTFMTGAEGRELVSDTAEGKRTRIMYMGPTELSPLAVLRNYQQAFADLGEVKEVYTCKGNDCFGNLGQMFTWRESNQIPNIFKRSRDLYVLGYSNQIYWYGKVTSPESLYHVSVYSAISTPPVRMDPFLPWSKKIRNHPLIHLEVVEVEDFKPTLEVVTAEDMTTKISDKGHIALYGIYFDFDSDKLKPESDPTLEQIAKALEADTDLNIYVVGHTDNKGALEYNEALSKRRAMAVVSKLSANYGIASDRLIPVGVGPAAPVSSNKTEEGQALNRRVELVER
jgi:outer membrane protein OmpA-like peptidoglycan-associated protein